MKNLLLLCGLSICWLSFLANDASTLDSQETHLFWISRSKDANFIYYDLNLNESGDLNQSAPITPYWIKKAEDGRKEDLTMIQENFAYGIAYDQISKTKAIFHFVSYPQRLLILNKDDDGIYRVHLPSGIENDVVLSKIHIQIDGGTFWVPNVTKVSVYGINSFTSSNYVEHIDPKK